MRKAIDLKENRTSMSICETEPRYDVLLYGARVSQLYFNTHGYRGVLPLPNGGRLDLGEKPIGSIRSEVTKLSRRVRRAMKAMSHVNANPTSSTAIPCAATTCHHCHKAIEWDGRDSYRHLTGFYSCLELGGWNQATPEHEL